MGLLVESETLANAVADSIENDISAGNSWQVVLKDDGELEWITVENGVITAEKDKELIVIEKPGSIYLYTSPRGPI